MDSWLGGDKTSSLCFQAEYQQGNDRKSNKQLVSCAVFIDRKWNTFTLFC